LAQNAQKKAARVGFDWDDAAQVLKKVEEEIEELRKAISGGVREDIKEELGDMFFSLVNLARKLDVDSETAAGGATRKFVQRFRAVEAEIVASGRTIEESSARELNALWDRHKRAERSES
jgi:nucleoside triphosphate diphosphatase